jgi:transposase
MTPLEAGLTEENEALRKENARQAQEIKLLREKIDLLVRRVFGASSEKLDTGQLLLALEGEEAKKPEASGDALGALEADPTSPAKPSRQRKSKGGITDALLDSLPSVEIVLDPEEVRAEPEAWRQIDEQVTRQLDYEPPRYVCRRIVRRRYVRRDEPHRPPVIAELPTMLERSKAGPGLLASILTAKYCDHLPLYRQEQIARWRHGIDLTRQDMSRWVGLSAEWLRPLYQLILGGILDDDYAQFDETAVQYLLPGSGRAQNGFLWVVKRPGGDAAFHWATTRAATVLEKIVPVDFSGIIQCDGYIAYPAFANWRAPGRRTAHGSAHRPSLHHRSKAAPPRCERQAACHNPPSREPAHHRSHWSDPDPLEKASPPSATERDGRGRQLHAELVGWPPRLSRRRTRRDRQQRDRERDPPHRGGQEELALHRGCRGR